MNSTTTPSPLTSAVPVSAPQSPAYHEPLVQQAKVQRFGIDRVLSMSVSAFGRNLVRFGLVGTLVYLPVIGYYLWALEDESVFLDALDYWEFIVGAGDFPLSLMLMAAVTYGSIQQFRGERVSISETLGAGVKRALPVLGATLLSCLAIGCGFLLLIVPGIMIYCALWVAVPVAVIERPGARASLSRSSELTRGNRWSIFGLMALIFGAGWLSTYLLQSAFSDATTVTELKVFMGLNLGVDIALAIFTGIVGAASYHELVRAKETGNVEDLTAVFG